MWLVLQTLEGEVSTQIRKREEKQLQSGLTTLLLNSRMFDYRIKYQNRKIAGKQKEAL